MMKAETTRRLVVDHTKREMIRQGISRLTMHIIAQGLDVETNTLPTLSQQGLSCTDLSGRHCWGKKTDSVGPGR